MSEHPSISLQPVPDGAAADRAVGASAPSAAASPGTASRAGDTGAGDREADPVTAWLLQRNDLDADEFSVLFAIHKLRARRRQAGWITHGELGRSTGLAPAALARVRAVLCRRGLVWMARHPVKPGWARYCLIVR